MTSMIGAITSLSRDTRWSTGLANTYPKIKNPTRPVPVQAHTGVKGYEDAENSTTYRVPPKEVERKVQALFEVAREEFFEDGIESQLSKGLESLVKKHGENAIEVLANLVINERINAEVAAETLRWLGRISHPSTYSSRLWLLERSLFCSSARVRDGAALGLASLDDSTAIPYLIQAIGREKITELREDMRQVLSQLEENPHEWHTS